jgi:hypothetical protein
MGAYAYVRSRIANASPTVRTFIRKAATELPARIRTGVNHRRITKSRGRSLLSLNTIQTVIDRVRAEFLKAPNLPLSVEQMQLLSGADRSTVEMVLEFLADTKFLSRTSTYARMTQVDISCAPAADTGTAYNE